MQREVNVQILQISQKYVILKVKESLEEIRLKAKERQKNLQ